MNVRWTTALAALLCVTAAVPALADDDDHHEDDHHDHHHHHGDLIIGRTAGGQLALDFDTSERVLLEPITSGPLSGWSGNAPGFDDLGLDEPDEGIYTLDDGTDIEVVFTSIPTAFAIWDGLSPVSGSYDLPTPDPHKHLTWHINSADGDYDPAVTDYPLSFYFTDTSNTYTDSPTYTVTFTNVPEPTALALLGAGGLVCLAGRRRRGQGR
jgi:hypothetical protein